MRDEAMDLSELYQLIRNGEGPRVEFKSNFPEQGHDLAKEMVALPNSGGGILLLGVADDGRVVGVPSPNRAVERLAGIANSCQPPLFPEIDKIHVCDDLCVVFARVKSNFPSLYKDSLYVRVGSLSRKLTGDELRALFLSSHSSRDEPSQPTPRIWSQPEVPREGLSIASLGDVLDWGWDGKTLLEHLIKLDYETIPGLTSANEGHSEQWAPVFMDHPDTWRLLISGPREIVGYWHFVPLFPKEYGWARKGELLDGQITSDKLCYFELGGVYNAYFVSIARLPRYCGVQCFRLLLDSLFERFTYLAQNGIFFDEICANAFTEQGMKLCKTLGMKHVADHTDHGHIYAERFLPLPNIPLFRNYPKFRQYYSAFAAATD